MWEVGLRLREGYGNGGLDLRVPVAVEGAFHAGVAEDGGGDRFLLHVTLLLALLVWLVGVRIRYVVIIITWSGLLFFLAATGARFH